MRTYLKDRIEQEDWIQTMDPKLKAHCNEMLGIFVRKIQKREKTSLMRLMALYACIRLAHQKCNNEPEKRFWSWYLTKLEARAEEMKHAELRRRQNIQ